MQPPIPKLLITSAFLWFLAGSAAAQCNSAPVAVNDQVDYFGRPISVEPMLNDQEPSGEALRLTVISHNCNNPTTGSAVSVLVDNGTVRLVPSVWGAPAVCTINYRIEDERGFSDDAQMFLQLNSMFVDGFETGNTSRWYLTQTSGGGVEP